MIKTFQTTKSKEEIIAEIDRLRENGNEIRREDKVLYPIWFSKGTKLRVDCTGKGTTYWKLNLETPGEITAKRCSTFMDWVLVLLFVAFDLLVAFLIFHERFSMQVLLYGILILAALILCEFLPTYYFRVLSPARKLKKFVQKFLGGSKAAKKADLEKE